MSFAKTAHSAPSVILRRISITMIAGAARRGAPGDITPNRSRSAVHGGARERLRIVSRIPSICAAVKFGSAASIKPTAPETRGLAYSRAGHPGLGMIAEATGGKHFGSGRRWVLAISEASLMQSPISSHSSTWSKHWARYVNRVGWSET